MKTASKLGYSLLKKKTPRVLPGIFAVEEWHLSMTVCPLHRSLFGTRWRCNKTRCTVPSAVSVHGFTGSKGQCGLKSGQSEYILRTTKMLVPVGSREYTASFFLN